MKYKALLTFSILILLCLIFSFSVTSVDWFKFKSDNLFDTIKSGADKNESDVIVEVNGEKIYSQSVEAQLKSDELSNQLQQTIIDERTTVDEKTKKKEIIDKKIRNIVVRQKAEQLGLTADYETAKTDALNAYNNLKEANSESYRFLLNYMEEMNYTEEDYIEVLTAGYIEMYTRANLYEWFVKDKTGTYEQLVTEYEEYVQTLIQEANIVYK